MRLSLMGVCALTLQDAANIDGDGDIKDAGFMIHLMDYKGADFAYQTKSDFGEGSLGHSLDASSYTNFTANGTNDFGFQTRLVPEPGSLTALAVGLLCFGMGTGRRRRD